MPIPTGPGRPDSPIMFPDVELWATTYLRDVLADYGYPGMYVSNARGKQPVAVWVRRDGGPTLDQVREVARLGVNVFAKTELEVAQLAETTAALLRAGATGSPVIRVRQISGPSPVTDSTPRRFMSFELTVRGAALSPS